VSMKESVVNRAFGRFLKALGEEYTYRGCLLVGTKRHGLARA